MPEPARNFVIIYSGRTGSSPVINILARQPGICVPVFEHLDHRFVGAERAKDIAGLLDRTFVTGVVEGVELQEFLPRFPAGETPRSIGFKWRPYGDWGRVCEVFRRHRVLLFVFTRRDFVEVASSLYITTHGNKLQNEVEISHHPQFGIAKGREETREKIARLQAMTLPVRPRLLYRVMRQQVRAQDDLVTLAREAHGHGVPVRAIHYEDFVADNAGFIRAMLAEIGMPVAGSPDTTTSFEKVMKVPAKTRLRHLDRWLWLPPLRYQMWLYHQGAKALTAVEAASRAGRALPARAPRTRPITIRG